MKTENISADSKLFSFLKSIRADSSGYYGIYFNLFDLLPQYRNDYQIKIAVNIISDIFKYHDGIIFQVSNYDIIILYKGEEKGLIEQAVFQIRYLFMDDPLSYDQDGHEHEGFCYIFDIEFQWKEFHNYCLSRLSKKAEKKNAAIYKDDEVYISQPNNTQEDEEILTPQYLSQIIDKLQRIDISAAYRSQSVCLYSKNEKIKAIFNEIYVNIEHLQKILSIKVDLLSENSLFQYLTKKLDIKILNLFASDSPIYLKPPISFNINISTLLSQDFVNFDKLIDSKLKPSVILEINVADLFDNMQNYIIARDLVHKLGYKLCIDGLDSLSLSQVQIKMLRFDLAKLRWQDSMSVASDIENITKSIKIFGANRTILCHCDDKGAIEFGHSLGISLFQGRYLDNILDPYSKVVN